MVYNHPCFRTRLAYVREIVQIWSELGNTCGNQTEGSGPKFYTHFIFRNGVSWPTWPLFKIRSFEKVLDFAIQGDMVPALEPSVKT